MATDLQPNLEVRVLGNVEVRLNAEPVAIGGPKPRQLLAMLVEAHGSVVATDRLCEELWGEDQPADPAAVLQSNVSRLRKILEPKARIVARPPGYLLEVEEHHVDAWLFDSLCREARKETNQAVAIGLYEQALAMWTGSPFAEFADCDWARADVTRLMETQINAREECLALRLEMGEDRTLVAELEALATEHPLRERPRLVLAMALHRSGRSADALRRISAFRSMLRDELGLDPPDAIRVIESRILESDPALLGLTRPLSGRRSRTPPVEVTPLVGRTADLIGVSALIANHSLVTLVGPGGVGKTRLAMRVAAEAWKARGGEVYLVELAPVHDPLLTVVSVATAIDVQQRQHLSVEDTLVEFLRGRGALLVLDNCEHLRTAVARLTEQLLAECTDLSVLTTSREVLGLASENVWRVEPLAVAGISASADDIANTAGVALFVDRAIASNPGFILGADNLEAVAAIVRRVDGLPLAIELAAARLRAISPAALAARLQQRFDLLDNAQFSPIERHQTVKELVAWSFNLLTANEQLLFARLSVFAGSFGLDPVESICADDGLDAQDVARVLAALVDKSMVQMTDSKLGRYRILEPLREFGRAQLAPHEGAAVGMRHAFWYLDLAERSGADLAGPLEALASARLERDFDNLRSAFSWMTEQRDVEGACRLVVALHEYSFRSMRAEVIAWADDVILMPGFDVAPQSPIVLSVASYGRFVRGDLDSSIAYGDLAIEAATRLDVGTHGLAERSLGNSWFYRGEASAAQVWMDRLLERVRTDSPARLAHALYMRSVAFTSVGNAQLGVEVAEQAFAPARRCGSPTALAQAMYALGLALESSDETAAASLLSQAAEVAAGAGNVWIQAFALTEVLWLEARRGSPRSALGGFAAVIDLWFRGGDWANQWLSLRHVFGILVQLDDHRGAATLHGALNAVGAAYALPFEATDAEHIAELVGMLRDRLGAADFAAAVRKGASMTDGQIVDFIQERIVALTH